MFCSEMAFAEVLKDSQCGVVGAMLVFTNLECLLNHVPGNDNVKTWLFTASESNPFKCDDHFFSVTRVVIYFTSCLFQCPLTTTL